MTKPIQYCKVKNKIIIIIIMIIKKEIRIPDHLNCLLRKVKKVCMQVKKQQSELDMKKQTGSTSGKEDVKAAYCHPVYCRLHHAKWWAGGNIMESRLLGEISITSSIQMTSCL